MSGSSQKRKRSVWEAEANANYKYFCDNLSSIRVKYPYKKFVLLKNREVQGGFESFEEAYQQGKKKYGRDAFSIQEIDPKPLSMGIFNALP